MNWICSSFFRVKMDNLFHFQCSCGKRNNIKCSLIVLVIVQFLGFIIPSASAFNLDLKNPIIQRGETGSMFGFSVAQHLEQGEGW